MLTIYLDLDGTLLDVSDRYWSLHSALVARHSLTPIPRQSFWCLKRRRAPLSEIVGGDEAGRSAYWKDWLRLIESPEYLANDKVIPGAHDALAVLCTEHALVLVTMRKDSEAAERQLTGLGLRAYFSALLCENGANVAGKQDLLPADSNRDPGRCLMVGDTEADIDAGRALGIPTVGVLTGLRDRDGLSAASPAYVVESVAELPAIVRAVTATAVPG